MRLLPVIFALFSAAACAVIIDAPNIPLKASEVSLESQKFSSIPDAAIEGLRQSLAKGSPARAEEWGGAIVEIPGHLFLITAPRTDHALMAVRTPIFEPISGHKVVADFHTHVCAHNPTNGHRILSEFFSPTDIAHTNALKIDGYILDMCLGTVYYLQPYEFDPDGPHMGHVVGWLAEIAD